MAMVASSRSQVSFILVRSKREAAPSPHSHSAAAIRARPATCAYVRQGDNIIQKCFHTNPAASWPHGHHMCAFSSPTDAHLTHMWAILAAYIAECDTTSTTAPTTFMRANEYALSCASVITSEQMAQLSGRRRRGGEWVLDIGCPITHWLGGLNHMNRNMGANN